MKKENESFEDWDRRRVYWNKIIFIIAALISMSFVWYIIIIGAIKYIIQT